MSRWIVSSLAVLAACGGDAGPDLSVEAAGDFAVGTQRTALTDAASGRALTIQAWYPADEAARADAEAGFEIAELEDEPNRTAYLDLRAAAPLDCTTPRAHAARDAAVAAGTFPVVLFSHCHECTRFSAMTVAERLASHGFVVVSVEHTDNTLWDYLDDTGVDLDGEFLPVRGGDVSFALDAALAGDLPAIAGAVDAERVGVFGHSFGGVTAGYAAQEDARIDAAFAIAAPMDNPLLPGVMIEGLDLPLGFLVAAEDNSITELGNDFIRDNFADAPGPAWKMEVADAGHWSFSDLNGLAPFLAGCGEDARQTDGTAFTYLDPEEGRAIAAAHVTAFFAATLRDEAGAEAYLTAQRGAGVTALAR